MSMNMRLFGTDPNPEAAFLRKAAELATASGKGGEALSSATFLDQIDGCVRGAHHDEPSSPRGPGMR